MAKNNLFNPVSAESTEPFPLSRSKLDDFLTCPRCFYLDRRLGIKRPGMPPFTLNNAVDCLLKKEFDAYRARQQPHPIMAQYDINALPFAHPDLSTWRSNFKGIRFHHKPTNLMVYGAPDDLWVEPDGNLILVDYKATSSKETVITLDTEYRQGYKRQLEFYGWLFRQNAFPVSKRAFILYANAQKDRDGFNGKLEFDLQLIEHQGNDEWVEPALIKAKECLMADVPPDPAEGCEWCQYRQAKAEVQTVQSVRRCQPEVKPRSA
jgi:hypothetical protein